MDIYFSWLDELKLFRDRIEYLGPDESEALSATDKCFHLILKEQESIFRHEMLQLRIYYMIMTVFTIFTLGFMVMFCIDMLTTQDIKMLSTGKGIMSLLSGAGATFLYKRIKEHEERVHKKTAIAQRNLFAWSLIVDTFRVVVDPVDQKRYLQKILEDLKNKR